MNKVKRLLVHDVSFEKILLTFISLNPQLHCPPLNKYNFTSQDILLLMFAHMYHNSYFRGKRYTACWRIKTIDRLFLNELFLLISLIYTGKVQALLVWKIHCSPPNDTSFHQNEFFFLRRDTQKLLPSPRLQSIFHWKFYLVLKAIIKHCRSCHFWIFIT